MFLFLQLATCNFSPFYSHITHLLKRSNIIIVLLLSLVNLARFQFIGQLPAQSISSIGPFNLISSSLSLSLDWTP